MQSQCWAWFSNSPKAGSRAETVYNSFDLILLVYDEGRCLRSACGVRRFLVFIVCYQGQCRKIGQELSHQVSYGVIDCSEPFLVEDKADSAAGMLNTWGSKRGFSCGRRSVDGFMRMFWKHNLIKSSGKVLHVNAFWMIHYNVNWIAASVPLSRRNWKELQFAASNSRSTSSEGLTDSQSQM